MIQHFFNLVETVAQQLTFTAVELRRGGELVGGKWPDIRVTMSLVEFAFSFICFGDSGRRSGLVPQYHPLSWLPRGSLPLGALTLDRPAFASWW